MERKYERMKLQYWRIPEKSPCVYLSTWELGARQAAPLWKRLVRQADYFRVRIEVQRLLGHDPLQPTVLFLQLPQPPRLVHFQAPVLRLPVVERCVAHPQSSAQILHRDPGLRLLQHPYDLLFTKPALPHGLLLSGCFTPEKLHFGWTSFRGAGQVLRRSCRLAWCCSCSSGSWEWPLQ